MKQIPIVMPQMGQSVAEGTIRQWKKKVGDTIEADEAIVEVETDKTTVEVESPAAGKMAACLKQEGEIAAAGEIIGMIECEADEPASEEPKPHAGGREAEAVLVTSLDSAPDFVSRGSTLPEIDRDRYSPFVLRLAMLNNVSIQELDFVQGTGRHGRITKNDLQQYLAHRPIAPPSVSALTGKPEASKDDLASLGNMVPMTSLRRTIADHMVQSIRTSAHVTMVHTVDMTHIVEMRKRIKEAFEKKFNARMTYTAVILFVTARVLRDFPKVNASIYGTNIILRKDINIGCAVALADETLVVPVVHNADKRSFPQVCQELGRLIGLARQKSLTRTDVDNGTFTLSNFGSFGSTIGTPIINQPQVAILGMGAVIKAPVVKDSQIVIRDQLHLSFSFDHRIIDGELGGRFLHAIQTSVEALTEETLEVTGL